MSNVPLASLAEQFQWLYAANPAALASAYWSQLSPAQQNFLVPTLGRPQPSDNDDDPFGGGGGLPPPFNPAMALLLLLNGETIQQTAVPDDIEPPISLPNAASSDEVRFTFQQLQQSAPTETQGVLLAIPGEAWDEPLPQTFQLYADMEFGGNVAVSEEVETAWTNFTNAYNTVGGFGGSRPQVDWEQLALIAALAALGAVAAAGFATLSEEIARGIRDRGVALPNEDRPNLNDIPLPDSTPQSSNGIPLVTPEPPRGGFNLLEEQGPQILTSEDDAEDVLRRYVPHDKHSTRGAWSGATPMDLDNATAQQVLNDAIQLSGRRQLFGYHDGVIYVFQPDNTGGFHGYPSAAGDRRRIPVDVLRELRERGTISKSEYRDLLNQTQEQLDDILSDRSEF